ncbi:MAG: hypothetical protein HKN24_14835 [Acidimicrobiales bacterium]|nr:hypothetical protein [Acidimicrobiales bacterium]
MSDGVTSRRLALDVLERIDRDGAYANLVLRPALDSSVLSTRDKALVTELVYGSTRMRRALDAIVEPFLAVSVDHHVRAALRLGAYQLHFLRIPAHAAVSATVGATRKRPRGLVNAVLRKVASVEPTFDGDAVRLSYPDWIVDRLTADLGAPDALRVLEAMNEPLDAHVRTDGYVQDRASQDVVGLVDASAGDVVLDVCAAPGGKATGIAGSGAKVIAGDVHLRRCGLISKNARSTGTVVAVVAADATSFPVRAGAADIVLIDAPCSGLGSLRRRPDARWRIDPEAPDRLSLLQKRLVAGALPLVRPGGRLIYSVCTLTNAETSAVAAEIPWEPLGQATIRFPDENGDGMWSQVFLAPG